MKLLHLNKLTGHEVLWHWLILLLLFLLLYIIFPQSTHSTEYIWEVFSIDNTPLEQGRINDIAVDLSGNVWFATLDGLLMYDDGEWTLYSTRESNIPENHVNGVAVDAENGIWIATDYGAGWLHDGEWTNYLMQDTGTGLENEELTAIAIDRFGTVWFGMTETGVCSFDGIDWTWYFSTNTPELTGYRIQNIFAHSDSSVWFATDSGAVSYRNGIWTHHEVPIPGTNPSTINVVNYIEDGQGNIYLVTVSSVWKYDGNTWSEYPIEVSGEQLTSIQQLLVTDDICFAGSTHGLAVSDGIGWNQYTTTNSPLPHSVVTSLALDHDGDLWLGTYSGVAVVRGLSVMQVMENDMSTPMPIVLTGNYPNPFNPTTTISYALPSRSHIRLTVYNATGQLVRSYDFGVQDTGSHEYIFDGSGLPSGVYLYQVEAGGNEVYGRMLLMK